MVWRGLEANNSDDLKIGIIEINNLVLSHLSALPLSYFNCLNLLHYVQKRKARMKLKNLGLKKEGSPSLAKLSKQR